MLLLGVLSLSALRYLCVSGVRIPSGRRPQVSVEKRTTCMVLCLNPELNYPDHEWANPAIEQFCDGASMVWVDPTFAVEGVYSKRLFGEDTGIDLEDVVDKVAKRPLRLSKHFTRNLKGSAKSFEANAVLLPWSVDRSDFEARWTKEAPKHGFKDEARFDYIIEASCPVGGFLNKDNEASMLHGLLKANGRFVTIFDWFPRRAEMVTNMMENHFDLEDDLEELSDLGETRVWKKARSM